MNGIFTISLDFELHWGGFEKWPLLIQDSKFQVPDSVSYNQYFLNTRLVIPKILALFEKHGVHVTWAAVGLLLHESKKELLENAPKEKPTYTVSNLSAYHYINTIGIGKDEHSDPFHFAPTLVKQILATPNQELGTHTFSHYYCNEVGQTVEQFQEDLRAAKRVAKIYGVALRSLVFPRNQFNDNYLKVCYDEGITSVRSNPQDWFWRIDSTQRESIWKRFNRGVDAYFPIGKKKTYPLNSIHVRDGYPLCQPASRLLRSYKPKEVFLNDFKIEKIKSEMSRAAKRGEVYHLWWHPHNFGNYPEQNMKGLTRILEHFNMCNKRWNLKSLNMGEIANQLLK